MGSRLNLQTELESILGSKNVYFQPPESEKIKYDAIVYRLDDISSRQANNKNYMNHKRYEVSLITRKADNNLVNSIIEYFSYCIFNRSFVTDNLYHHVFYIYY